MNHKYIIGIDGGASKTRGVVFNDSGQTIAHKITCGSNISVNEKSSAKIVVDLIVDLSKESNIDINDFSAVGIALAGASNETGRQRLFGLLDNLKLSSKSIITSDVESVYNFMLGSRQGILVNVGTGIACIAKKENSFIKVAGKGHDKGDIGSGYWIAKEAIVEIGLNESVFKSDIDKMNKLALGHFNVNNYDDLITKINDSENKVSLLSSFAKTVILEAENGNEIAVSIVQQATRIIGDYILELKDLLGYGSKNIIIAANGSIIKNDYFRSDLNNSLSFDFVDIKWLFLDICPSYAAGLLCADLKSMKVNKKKIVGNNPAVEY